MITIDELIKKQQEFDEKHSSNFNWSAKIDDDNIELLQHLLLSMVGEFGETANLVKKVVRGDKKLYEIKDHLSEEIIDVLIYVLKLIYQLDIDVEKIFLKKMKKNSKRFKNYERE